jgi:hypothetical protein
MLGAARLDHITHVCASYNQARLSAQPEFLVHALKVGEEESSARGEKERV